MGGVGGVVNNKKTMLYGKSRPTNEGGGLC